MIKDCLTITKQHAEHSPSHLEQLFTFLGCTNKEYITEDLYYIKNGEPFDYKGYTLSESNETAKTLREGDVLVNTYNNQIQHIPADLAWLVYDSLYVEKYENLLDKIYQSGLLDREMEELYLKEMGIC